MLPPLQTVIAEMFYGQEKVVDIELTLLNGWVRQHAKARLVDNGRQSFLG